MMKTQWPRCRMMQWPRRGELISAVYLHFNACHACSPDSWVDKLHYDSIFFCICGHVETNERV